MTEQELEIQHDPSVFKGLPFTWAALTDTGRSRQKNEDTFIIEPEIGLFLVSDGMGGHPAGEVASDFVSQNLSVRIEAALHSLHSKSPRAIRRLLKKSVHYHNQELWWESQSESGSQGMGATVILCLICDQRAYVVNLGDSRLYRLRKKRLKQLSRDHSVVNELIEAGHLDPEQARYHVASGQITQYVGMDDEVQPHIRSFSLQPNDRLLLCSDGLTDMLPNETIRSILCEHPVPQSAVQSLIDQANEAGGFDNITAVIIDWRVKSAK